MLRANAGAMRRSTAAAAAARRLSTQRRPPTTGSAPKPPAMGGGSPAGKAPVSPTLPPPPPPSATLPPASGSATEASKSSSSGAGFGTLLLFTALSAPAGAAVYLRQNPEWNPELVRNDTNWIKFRELVLSDSLKSKKPVAPATQRVAAKPNKPKEPSKTPEELSAMISKANPAATLQPKPKPAASKPAEQPKPVQAATEKKKATGPVAAKAAAAEETTSVKKTHKPEAKKPTKEETTVAKKDETVVLPVAPAVAAVTAAAGAAVNEAKAVVDEVVDEAKAFVDKIVDSAVTKERAALDKLAQDATPAALGNKIDTQILATTKEIIETLRAEATDAASDVDKNYLNGIHELDSNALAIRVAQLATEMKHRSKWEAVRMVEALRRMEEDSKKKSSEILHRQQVLHTELLERELRLQQEISTRKTREEMETLKRQYTDDLSRNVQKEKTAILKTLQDRFAADKMAIEEKYAQQLKAKSESFQATLTHERKQRVEELENYRAQLRALNAVLERTSTYEAFSHQVHKASMAALALSDRIEAAGPLRTEIRVLREFARNDPFIEVALKTLPEHVIEEGAPSVGQLQERFKTVKAVGRRAAMVPEGSGLMGQLFGGALSYLLIPPGGPIEGEAPDAIFSRADYALKAGDIEKAVTEMKTLKGLPADVSRDWIAAAEDRLAVEQTAKVVKAHVSLLAASCS